VERKRTVRYERHSFNAEAQRTRRRRERRDKNGGQENIKENLCELCASAFKDLLTVRFRFMKIVNNIHDFGGVRA
jgi:hypothetical protein